MILPFFGANEPIATPVVATTRATIAITVAGDGLLNLDAMVRILSQTTH